MAGRNHITDLIAIAEGLEIRFRLFDGTDICHGYYPVTTTIDTIKERLLAEWPQDKPPIPTSVEDIRIINAGVFLRSGRTLEDSRLSVTLGDVTTMHVVVQPPIATRQTGKRGKRRTDNQSQEAPRCCFVL